MVSPGVRTGRAEPGLHGGRGVGSVSQAAGNSLGWFADQLLDAAVSILRNAGKSRTALYPGMLSRCNRAGSGLDGWKVRGPEARPAISLKENPSYENGCGR